MKLPPGEVSYIVAQLSHNRQLILSRVPKVILNNKQMERMKAHVIAYHLFHLYITII